MAVWLSVQAAQRVLPVLTHSDERRVASVVDITCQVRDENDMWLYALGTFDADRTASSGIAAIMFGARRGDRPMGPDIISVEGAIDRPWSLETP